jgi:hypothetical protein
MVHGIASVIQGTRSLGQGTERGLRLPIVMSVLHGLSGAIGGAGLAVAVWAFSIPVRTLLPRTVVVGLFACVAVLAMAADTVHTPMPARHIQVPKSWYGRYGPVRSYALYGLVLGAGLLTDIPYAVTYTIFASGLVLPIGLAVLLGALFGLGRTAVVGPITVHHRVVEAITRSFPRLRPRLPIVSALASLMLLALILTR